jgi:periplasmic protein CpxP/Spy
MDRQPKDAGRVFVRRTDIRSLLQKAGLLLGALFLGWAAQAQSTTTTPTDSTHHQYGMRHGWGHRPGADSLTKASGFHRHPGGQDGFRRPDGQRGFGREGWANRGGRKGGRDGWANRGGRGGHRGFGHGRGGFGRGERIPYTPEQRKQVAAINKDYHQKAQDLFKQDNLTLKQYKADLVSLQKEKKDKMAALLTPQQKDELAARRKRMDENRQVMEVARLERLKLRLNLTDDQVARIKAGQENLHSQVKAIHENDNLLPQQKMEQMKALLAKRNDTYKAVLTPEQYSQFEKMHEHGFGRPGGFDHGGRRFGGPGAAGPGGTGAI